MTKSTLKHYDIENDCLFVTRGRSGFVIRCTDAECGETAAVYLYFNSGVVQKLVDFLNVQ